MALEPFVFRYEGAVIEARERPGDDEALHAINRFALRPLKAEEVAVFTMDLCNDQVDRHHSRFPLEELEKISAMVPGRPLMERHDLQGSLPRGTFFRSALHNGDARTSVRPDVYVLRTQGNADFILNIEGGVYRETSIGFSFGFPECSVCKKDIRTCDHVPGRSYSDERCHYLMHDVLEVIEGSIVASGSQGTGFVGGDRNLPTLGEALGLERDRFHEPVEISPRLCWADE